MCDFSGRLVAWIDGELEDAEAAIVERHVQDCAECQQQVAAYEEVGREFAAYCDVVLNAATPTAVPTESPRRLPRWVPVLATAAVAAGLLMAVLPRSIKPAPVVPQISEVQPPIMEKPVIEPLKPPAKQHVAAHKKPQRQDWAMAEPAIRIAIPAEAMFPPGAVPEGVTFVANLSLGADGSVQGLRLQP